MANKFDFLRFFQRFNLFSRSRSTVEEVDVDEDAFEEVDTFEEIDVDEDEEDEEM